MATVPNEGLPQHFALGLWEPLRQMRLEASPVEGKPYYTPEVFESQEKVAHPTAQQVKFCVSWLKKRRVPPIFSLPRSALPWT